MGDRLCPRGHPNAESARRCGTCGEPLSSDAGGNEDISPRGTNPATPNAAPPGTSATGGTSNDVSLSPRDAASERPLRSRDHRWLWAAGALALVVLLGGGISVAAFVKSPRTPTTTSTTSTSTVPDQLSDQHAASSIARLLAASATERGVVVAAVHDVGSCGRGLTSDGATFARSVAARRALLAKLALIRRRSSLSQGMFVDLAAAWQASIQADRDFMRWARDEVSHGCIIYDPSDRYLSASTAPDSEATFFKTAFTKLWDPIARTYHEPTYRPNQL